MDKKELIKLINTDFRDRKISDKSIKQYFEVAKQGARVPVRDTLKRVWLPNEYEKYREEVLSREIP